jgi:ribosomal protein S18 acetylase RimI-like enzyme
MILREARLEDLDALMEIEHACFGAKDSPLSKRAMRYHLVRGRVTGAYKEGLLGYTLLFPRKIPRIYSLAVHPSARGQGVAHALLWHALHVNKRLRLEVRADNLGAIALYERLGFTCKGVKKRFYPDGCDAKVYVKQKG